MWRWGPDHRKGGSQKRALPTGRGGGGGTGRPHLLGAFKGISLRVCIYRSPSINQFIQLTQYIISNGFYLSQQHTYIVEGRKLALLHLAPPSFQAMQSLYYLPISPILYPVTCHLTHQKSKTPHNLSVSTLLGTR